MNTLKEYQVKNSPLNILHNRIRTSHALKLYSNRNKLYKEYKIKGGKRTLSQLLKIRPIRKIKPI